MTDGQDLHVWISGWQSSRKYTHSKRLTALSIDPQRRYITVGDEQGVVRTWWGILDERATFETIVPARWHWHSNQVLSLAHCGPLILSGGEEGVLCIRRADDDQPHFVPRLLAALSHIATTPNGKSCLCLSDNSLAILDSLHGYSKPRWVRAVDLPPPPNAKKKKNKNKDDVFPERPQRPLLYSLPSCGVVATCSERRVHLFNDKLGMLPPRSLALGNKGNTVAPRSRDADKNHKWLLRQAAISSDTNTVMTWETRVSPALEKFDRETAETGVLKWWRRGGGDGPDGYMLDTISHTAHSGDVTVALALPQRGGIFVTASRDGCFKSWEMLPLNEGASSACWQCFASGGWRSRPIQCGAASVDGSVLALGVEGAVVLLAPENGSELGVLPLTGSEGQ